MEVITRDANSSHVLGMAWLLDAMTALCDLVCCGCVQLITGWAAANGASHSRPVVSTLLCGMVLQASHVLQPRVTAVQYSTAWLYSRRVEAVVASCPSVMHTSGALMSHRPTQSLQPQWLCCSLLQDVLCEYVCDRKDKDYDLAKLQRHA